MQRQHFLLKSREIATGRFPLLHRSYLFGHPTSPATQRTRLPYSFRSFHKQHHHSQHFRHCRLISMAMEAQESSSSTIASPGHASVTIGKQLASVRPALGLAALPVLIFAIAAQHVALPNSNATRRMILPWAPSGMRACGASSIAYFASSRRERSAKGSSESQWGTLRLLLSILPSRSVVPRAARNESESSPNPSLPVTAPGCAHSNPFTLSPGCRWPSASIMAASNDAPPAKDSISPQSAKSQDMLTLFQFPGAPSSSAVPHPATSVEGPIARTNGLSNDFFSLFPQHWAATPWTGHSGNVLQPSGRPASPTQAGSERYAASSVTNTTRPRRTQPRGALSLRQEMQAAKDDFGIPVTRDVSRDTSPDSAEGRDHVPVRSSPRPTEFAKLAAQSGFGPDVPGVLSSEAVAELFDK